MIFAELVCLALLCEWKGILELCPQLSAVRHSRFMDITEWQTLRCVANETLGRCSASAILKPL